MPKRAQISARSFFGFSIGRKCVVSGTISIFLSTRNFSKSLTTRVVEAVCAISKVKGVCNFLTALAALICGPKKLAASHCGAQANAPYCLVHLLLWGVAHPPDNRAKSQLAKWRTHHAQHRRPLWWRHLANRGGVWPTFALMRQCDLWV